MPRPPVRDVTSTSLDRRGFLQGSLALGAGYWLGGSTIARAEGPNEKLNLAVVGIGGRGSANLGGVSSQNIVALCDVDEQRAGKSFERFEKAKKYADFRRMLDDLDGQLDGVVISTPDHTHFHPAYMAMQRGLHTYVEKPLAHSVWECRELTNLAAKNKLATQLGTQRHTIGNVRRVAEILQSGAIGDVKEVHSWVGGSRGMPKIPTDFPKVPDTLAWDLWLGPAEERPFSPAYAPYHWRFWWDFGTGETGNWGCHILDIPYWGLGLKYPTRVDATSPEPHPQTTPKSMSTRFVFPATDKRPEVVLHWYHGTPPILKEMNIAGGGMNNLFIGSKATLVTGFGSHRILPDDAATLPTPYLPKSPGFYNDWIRACKGGEPAECNFDYSGPMSETVLLGNVAFRAGGFDWDAEKLEAKGNQQAQELIRPAFRQGWEV